MNKYKGSSKDVLNLGVFRTNLLKTGYPMFSYFYFDNGYIRVKKMYKLP